MTSPGSSGRGLASVQGGRLVDAADLPEYPFGRDERLAAHHFTMFWHDRWLSSELHLMAPDEVQGVALNLFFYAQRQTPIGSLPDNDAMLARLLRMDITRWMDLRARPLSPLHNWVPYLSDGRRVLGHPVVIESLQVAFDRREARIVSNSEKAVAERLRRLRAAMHAMGCDRAVVGDAVLVERLDGWLLEHCPGRRMQRDYDRAMDHAARQGWFGASVKPLK